MAEKPEAPERIWAFKRPNGGNSWHTERLEATDVEYTRVGPASSITEKAQRAVSTYVSTHANSLRQHERRALAAIIAAEFFRS